MNLGETFLFVEKYRPQVIDDCVLSSKLKQEIKDYVKSGQIPHFLFAGTAGVGKTTVAKAICHELGADMLYINASNENGIDVIRNKVVSFASTSSFEQNLKVILLDEADALSVSAQKSLRSILEEFHKTTRFILTCNFKNSIIEPLHSRLTSMDFNIPSDERKDVLAQAFKRVVMVLRKEEIEFDVKAVGGVVQKYFPDLRKVLNEIQRYSVSGKIDSGILLDVNTTTEELVGYLRDKKFTEARGWLARNPDLDHLALFRYFYDNLMVIFTPDCTPDIVLLLAQYQYMATKVVDQEINSMALMVELMGTAKWK